MEIPELRTLIDFLTWLCELNLPKEIVLPQKTFWHVYFLLNPASRCLEVHPNPDDTNRFYFRVMGGRITVHAAEDVKRPSFIDFSVEPPKVVY